MPVDPPRIPAFPTTEETRKRPRRPRSLYIVLTAMMTVFVVWGFWGSYFGPLVGGEDLDRPLVIHLHAIATVGWLVLLFVQVGLVATRRKDLHKQLGNYGIGVGVAVLLAGIAATLVAPALHVQSGDWTLDRAASFLILPIGDLLLFAVFFIPSIVYKNQHGIHKRLVVLATVALVFPGAARAMSIPDSPILFLLIWLSPVIVAAVVDAITLGKIHKVYVLGTGVILAVFARVLVMDAEAWLRIGRPIVRAMMAVV